MKCEPKNTFAVQAGSQFCVDYKYGDQDIKLAKEQEFQRQGEDRDFVRRRT